MRKVIAPLGILLGAAVWVLLFVILGTGLGTAFIAAGSVAATGLLVAAMAGAGPIFDAPLTAPGLLVGIGTFVILEVVLSVPLWIDVVSGLGAIGLYGMLDAAIRPDRRTVGAGSATEHWFASSAHEHGSNGHDRTRREPIGAR